MAKKGEGKEIDVLIVGGGPIGFALAIDLGRRGVSSVVVERNAGTGTEFLAKADFLNERSMEFCRLLGVRDEVTTAGFPEDVSRDSVFCTALNGHFIGRVSMPSTQDRVLPPQCREMHRRCPQFWFDPILERTVLRQGMAEIRYGLEFLDCKQDNDGVTCFFNQVSSTTSEREEIRAKYVVAADGLASRVRKAVGIDRGGTQLGYSVSVIVKVNNLAAHHSLGMGERYMFISPEGCWANLTSVEGRQLYRFTVVGSEEKLDPAHLDMHALVRRAFGRDDIKFELMRVLPWRRSQFTAGTFSKGRVFLCGDSAHTMSPTGGHGLNTGLGDVTDLSWILQALLRGWGGPGLVEAYTAERRPVAIRNGTSSSLNYAVWVERRGREKVLESGPEADKQRRILGESMSASLQQEFKSLGIAMGYDYAASPVIVPDGTPAPPDEPSVYVQTARPGHRAPHCWLKDGSSIIDLFGGGFVLLCFGEKVAADRKLRDVAREISLPLDWVIIEEAEPARLYESRLVLVRPDGMVAWRSNLVPEDVKGLLDQVRGVMVT
jgi:2-polyprenyl-6-methoxyphenol hydroxylase-like FAD-dependent oxidoreductase